MNTYANAEQAYTQTSIMTAPPERLVIMLYDGLLRFLRQAASAMRAADEAAARVEMHRAQAIIDELNLSLDMRYGKIPEQLRSIYLFCKRQLTACSLRSDAEGVERVIVLLAELREAWVEAARATTATAA